MRLTTKGRVAVTAMLDLCMRQSRKPVTLAVISERQRISLSYLEQLFGKLRRHRLVDGGRGPGGGYRLAKDVAQISVADIIAAVDEPIDATRYGGKENCQDGQKSLTHDLWANLNDHILKVPPNDHAQAVRGRAQGEAKRRRAGAGHVRTKRVPAAAMGMRSWPTFTAITTPPRRCTMQEVLEA